MRLQHVQPCAPGSSVASRTRSMAARLAACSVRRTSPRREHYSAEAKEPPAEAAWRGGWAPTRATPVIASASCGHRRLVLIPDAHRRRLRYPVGWIATMTETASRPALPGGCNCGEIRYVVTRPFLTAYICHCHRCQKRTGSAFSMSVVIPADGLQIVAGKPLPTERPLE